MNKKIRLIKLEELFYEAFIHDIKESSYSNDSPELRLEENENSEKIGCTSKRVESQKDYRQD